MVLALMMPQSSSRAPGVSSIVIGSINPENIKSNVEAALGQ